MVENAIWHGLHGYFPDRALCSDPRPCGAYRQLLDMADPAGLPARAYFHAWTSS